MDGETEVTELLHLLGTAEAGFINGNVDVFKAAPAARNIIREFQQVGPVPNTADAEVETTAHSWDGKLLEMLEKTESIATRYGMGMHRPALLEQTLTRAGLGMPCPCPQQAAAIS